MFLFVLASRFVYLVASRPVWHAAAQAAAAAASGQLPDAGVAIAAQRGLAAESPKPRWAAAHSNASDIAMDAALELYVVCVSRSPLSDG